MGKKPEHPTSNAQHPTSNWRFSAKKRARKSCRWVLDAGCSVFDVGLSERKSPSFLRADGLEVALDQEARTERDVFLEHGILGGGRHRLVKFLVAAMRFRVVA